VSFLYQVFPLVKRGQDNLSEWQFGHYHSSATHTHTHTHTHKRMTHHPHTTRRWGHDCWDCYLWDGEWQVTKHVKGVGVMGADWTVQGTAQLTREQICDKGKMFRHQGLRWTEMKKDTNIAQHINIVFCFVFLQQIPLYKRLRNFHFMQTLTK